MGYSRIFWPIIWVIVISAAVSIALLIENAPPKDKNSPDYKEKTFHSLPKPIYFQDTETKICFAEFSSKYGDISIVVVDCEKVTGQLVNP